MNTVKHLKGSNSQRLRKTSFRFSINFLRNYLPTILLGVLLGTYLDLYFVGKGIYSFPIRPLPDIFSIHIVFTLLALPLLTAIFLVICRRLHRIQISGFILILGVLMARAESTAEAYGVFVHHESWSHLYSFIGYSLYLAILYFFHNWLSSQKE